MTNHLGPLPRDWLYSKPGIKWARAEEGELAAWVADMDFPIPEVVAQAVLDVIAVGDLGYPDLRLGPRLAQPFVDRARALHDLDLDPGRVREFDDVLNAIQAVLHVSVPAGRPVAIHTPAYPPFLDTLDRMGYAMVPIPYRRQGGRWTFDIEAACAAISTCDAMILVNPHNPTGRVLEADELGPLVMSARESGTLVIADEVHSDLIYPGHRHLPLAALEPQSVTVTSATKAFNLAGIRCAVAYIGSDDAWQRLESQPPHLFGAVSNLSVAATRAAWSPEGASWLEEVRRVLERNRRMVMDRLPQPFEALPPEATYLAWIDAGASLGAAPADELRRRSGVIVSPGSDFGPEWSGYFRINFATSSAILDEILDRLEGSLEPV